MKEKISYLDILKQSVRIIKENKKLLWLPFIIAVTMGWIDNKYEPNRSVFANIINTFFDFLHNLLSIIDPKFLIIATILFITLTVLIKVLLFVINLFSRIALISSISLLLEDKSFSLKKEFLSAKKFVWRILGLGMLVFFPVILLFIVLTVPILFFLEASNTPLFVTTLIGASLIFIPSLVLAAFIAIFGQIYLIKHNLSIKESIKNSYALVNNNLKGILLMGVILFLIDVLIFAFTSLLEYIIVHVATTDFIFTFLVTALVVLSLILYIFSFTIGQISWLILFQKIAKVEKPQEALAEEKVEIEAAAPEVKNQDLPVIDTDSATE